MSGEAMARAVGAKSPMTVKIGGKDCQVQALGIRELTEVQRDCVKRYKRAILETYAENADLLPKRLRDISIERKFEEVSRMDVDDLPLKHAYSADNVAVTSELKKYVVREFGTNKRAAEKTFQRVTASALDQGTLAEKQYKELTNSNILKVKVPYVSWWITGSVDGMLSFIWMAFKHAGVTREQVEDAVAKDQTLLAEVSREIERLSAPAVGNG